MTIATATPHTVAILGDSIADGLGVVGHAYSDLLPSLMGGRTVVQNFSGTGRTIDDSLRLLPDVVACRPNTVVIAHGNFDAVVQPVDRAMRWVPPRWRTKGWLDPRPYFSRRLLKGLYQRVESAVRWRYRAVLIRLFGGAAWTSPSVFDDALRRTIDGLLAQTDATILLLTPTGIDGRLYPGTPASMERLRQITRAVAGEFESTGRVRCGDVSCLLDRAADFFADGFHPNRGGHRKLAGAVAGWADEMAGRTG